MTARFDDDDDDDDDDDEKIVSIKKHLICGFYLAVVDKYTNLSFKLIDWFQWHVKLSKIILCQDIKGSSLLYIGNCHFCEDVSSAIFFV